MLQPVPTTHVEAVRQGDARSQVAIGNNILQIGSIHGGIVNISMLGALAPIPRSTPVYLRPRPFPGLLDRREEAVTAAAALRDAQPAEFYGETGLGKTSLFRHLAHRPPDTSYPDGIIYASIRGQTAADVLQFLFEAFYEASGAINFKPTEAQIRHGLQDKHALILLDDADLPRDDLQAVIDAAPGCAFLFASTERHVWGEGHGVALTGLPLEDALRLFERELGRSLNADERRDAETLCVALNGHPLRLLQAAALLREEKRSLKALLPALQVAAPGEALAGQIKGALSEPESQIVATLASVSGASLSGELIAAATGLADAGSVLERLARRGLAQSTGTRHSLPAGLLAIVSPQAVNQAAEKALVHVTAWAERNRHQPDRIVQEADAIQQLLKWAVQTRRWKETLRLVVAAEGALALGRRWGAWQQALQVGLQAARALRTLPAAEAWLLHQLGTRALCLGDASIARRDLIRALRLRESLRDARGAAITRHNLNILLGPPPPPDTPARPAPATPASAAPLLSGKLVAAFVGIITLTLTGLASAIPAQPATSTPTPTVTRAATLTATPSVETPIPTDQPTSTFTSTPTATATPIPSDTATNTATPTPIPCIPRYGWPIYIVQYGDTLFSIARRTNSSVYELELANCLVSQYIYIGQQLLVPRLPQPTDTPTPTFTPSPTITPSSTPYAEPVIDFKAEPFDIELGRCTTLSWSLENVTEAYLSGGSFSDYRVRTPKDAREDCPTATTAYTLRVVTPGGDVYRRLAVTVHTPAPFIRFWVDASELTVGECTIIHWRTENVSRVFYQKWPVAASGDVQECFKDNGVYLRELLVITLEGTQQTSQISINVTSPRQPPMVTITNPDSDAEYLTGGYDKTRGLQYTDVALRGSAVDFEGKAIPDASLTWTTDRVDLQGMTLGSGSQLTVRLYAKNCAAGEQHTLTLRATDRYGNVATTTRKITLRCLL